MNWETAKNWLIAAFLILDLVLSWQLYQSRRELDSYVESTADMVANTKTLLAEHGLVLNVDIPLTHPDMASLVARYADPGLPELVATAFPHAKTIQLGAFDGSAATSQGKVQLLGPGQWEVAFQAPIHVPVPKGLLPPQIVWHASDYVRDDALDGRGTVTYTEHYQVYPVFDATVVLSVGQMSAVHGYVQGSITQIHPVGNAKSTISALDALNSLANSVDKTEQAPDNKILSIGLGYTRKVSVNSNSSEAVDYWFPVWRIFTYNQVYYINAFTGEVSTSTP